MLSKLTFLIAISLILNFRIFCQDIKNASWNSRCFQRSDSIFRIDITAHLKEFLHIYSIECIQKVLNCTKIEYLDSTNCNVNRIIESGVAYHDKDYKELKLYEGFVVYSIELSKTNPLKPSSIKLNMLYQVCNDHACRRFNKVFFEIF